MALLIQVPLAEPRGARSLIVGAPWHLRNELLRIPGVVWAGGDRLSAPADAGFALARVLGRDVGSAAVDERWALGLPGLGRLQAILPRLRPYQAAGALFMAARCWDGTSLGGWAGLGDAMRLGKTATALAACEALGLRRVLCIVPAMVRLTWCEEIAKWVRRDALILDGRGGDRARLFCMACQGRPSRRVGGTCPACMLDGRTRWQRFRGAEAVARAIDAARFVIVNYELLIGQTMKDSAGKVFVRSDLPGFAPALSRHKFDAVILDEIHEIRGWSANSGRRGRTIRERVAEVADPMPVAFGLSGTLFCGFVADAWAPLDILSRGASTGRGDRLPFSFHARYCGGVKREYGWWYKGRSELADTELPERLRLCWLARSRREVGFDFEPKTRQVISIDEGMVDDHAMETELRRVLAMSSGRRSKIDLLRRATARIKLPFVASAISEELLAGAKTLAFTFNPDTARELAAAVTAKLGARELGPRVQQHAVQVWLCTDTSVDERHEIAARFREHVGAAAVICTIGSMQIGINLAGAVSEHWIDIHHTPAEMLQAEDRPNAVERTHGLAILYYVVPGSVDDHLIDLVLPKLEDIASVSGVADGLAIKKALRSSPDEMMDDVLARLSVSVAE